jgi:hypothetical protein
VARSVPREPRWAPGTAPAEETLWRWAVDQLPDRVLVLPQVAISVPTGGRYEEAEADLVLIDPRAGLTVVEAKGGTVSYDGRRAVWRRGGEEIRDPIAQAKRTRSVLRKALRSAGVEVERIALRWAVAVPECRLDPPGEPVLDDRGLWDALAREQLDRMYARTLGQLGLGERELDEELAEHIAVLLRGRTRDGKPALATLVDQHEEQVRIHTESHRNVLNHFAIQPHVLVRGAAGTGKTVLALQAAARFAAQGDRVLLACWNVVLAEWMRRTLRAELEAMDSPAATEVTDDPTGQVVVGHLVGLARNAVGDLSEITDEEERYYDAYPDRFTPAVTDGLFDVVVLDEAQDLSELWVLAVAELVAKDGRWYAFSDRHQDLFQQDPALPDFLELEHELRENFRNTQEIAGFAARFGPVEIDCVTGSGPPIRYVATSAGRVTSRTEEVARRLIREEKVAPSEVAALWLFHNPVRGRSDELADRALAGELVRTNTASFKGMERPVVVLGLDMDPRKTDRADEVRRSIYTGATRARSHLVVVGDADVAEAYGFVQLARDLRGTAGADGRAGERAG